MPSPEKKLQPTLKIFKTYKRKPNISNNYNVFNLKQLHQCRLSETIQGGRDKKI